MFQLSEKRFGPEKCPEYSRIPWVGETSLKNENQIKRSYKYLFSYCES